jgi:hypothetical protein
MQGNAFLALKILHRSLVIGFAFFIIIDFVLISQKLMEVVADKTLETTMQAIAALISIGGLLLGFTLFKKRLVAARNPNVPAEKRFDMYRGACILWWAMLEGPGLFATIAYLLTGNLVFIILALFHLGMMAMFAPRKDNIILILNLTPADVQKLEGVTKVQ